MRIPCESPPGTGQPPHRPTPANFERILFTVFEASFKFSFKERPVRIALRVPLRVSLRVAVRKIYRGSFRVLKEYSQRIEGPL